MEPQNQGNSSRPGPEDVEKKEVVKEREVPRVHSRTMQNEIRGVLGRMTASAARMILAFSIPCEVRV